MAGLSDILEALWGPTGSEWEGAIALQLAILWGKQSLGILSYTKLTFLSLLLWS